MGATTARQRDLDLLGLRDPHPTAEEVRRAYKKAALQAHPDKPGGSTERFKQVARAYENLMNVAKVGGK